MSHPEYGELHPIEYYGFRGRIRHFINVLTCNHRWFGPIHKMNSSIDGREVWITRCPYCDHMRYYYPPDAEYAANVVEW